MEAQESHEHEPVGTGLGHSADAMQALGHNLEHDEPLPSVGEFYAEQVGQVSNGQLKAVLARMAERRANQTRMWPGEDQPDHRNRGGSILTEDSAKHEMTRVVSEADHWFNQPTGNDSDTLLDLAGDDTFDHALLVQLSQTFDMHSPTEPGPDPTVPSRHETVYYQTNIPGVLVSEWRHRPDAGDLRHDGTDTAKYSLVLPEAHL
jgi:hypothetical protein